MSVSLTRSREGSRVLLARRYPYKKREHRHDDTFKKDALPKGKMHADQPSQARQLHGAAMVPETTT
jgi:hypothetical protein